MLAGSHLAGGQPLPPGKTLCQAAVAKPPPGEFWGARPFFHVILSEDEDASAGAWCGTPLLPLPPGKKPLFRTAQCFSCEDRVLGNPRASSPAGGDRQPQCGDRRPREPPWPAITAAAPQHPSRQRHPKGTQDPSWPRAFAGGGGRPEPRWVSWREAAGRLPVRGRWRRRGAAAAGPGGDAEHSWRAGYIWSGFQRAGPGPAPPPPARESAPRPRRHRGPCQYRGLMGGGLPLTGDPPHPFSAPTDLIGTGEDPGGSSPL